MNVRGQIQFESGLFKIKKGSGQDSETAKILKNYFLFLTLPDHFLKPPWSWVRSL